MNFDECNNLGTKGEKVIEWLMRRYYMRVDETPKEIKAQLLLADFSIPESTSLGIQREIIEVKTEVKHTGNLFFETVSNEATNRSGWAFTSPAHTLYYLFWDSGIAYRIPDFQTVMWNFDYCKGSFPEKPQNKHVQENVSIGKLVPVSWAMECYGTTKFDFTAVRDLLYPGA